MFPFFYLKSNVVGYSLEAYGGGALTEYLQYEFMDKLRKLFQNYHRILLFNKSSDGAYQLLVINNFAKRWVKVSMKCHTHE